MRGVQAMCVLEAGSWVEVLGRRVVMESCDRGVVLLACGKEGNLRKTGRASHAREEGGDWARFSQGVS